MPVYRTLTVGILSTGSELLAPGEPWAPGKIYDANGIQNAARLGQLGFAVQRRHCSDDPEAIACQLRELLTGCDAVITSGGVSVGQKDYLPAVLEQLGAQMLFAGVAQKPGSPMLAAEIAGKLVFCLSGNPFAAAATLEQYAVPALLRAAGRREEGCILPPYHLHPDHRLFQIQQGRPLPAGESGRRQRDHPRRGQRRSAFVRKPFCHDRL